MIESVRYGLTSGKLLKPLLDGARIIVCGLRARATLQCFPDNTGESSRGGIALFCRHLGQDDRIGFFRCGCDEFDELADIRERDARGSCRVAVGFTAPPIAADVGDDFRGFRDQLGVRIGAALEGVAREHAVAEAVDRENGGAVKIGERAPDAPPQLGIAIGLSAWARQRQA